MTGGLRIGSLCTGYGGLDMAVQAVLGGSLAWVSDLDPGASRILAHHHPRVPNLGDLTVVDWAGVEPVDVVCGGYPCQPFSTAGKRKGTADERHIWPSIAHALRVLRPRLAVFENVAGHLRLGFDTVLADLARLGFDAEWCLVRASEVDAPHQRQRLFLLAVDADPDRLRSDRRRTRGAGRDEPAPHRLAPAHHGGTGLEVRRVEPHRDERPAARRGRGEPPADTDPRGRRAYEQHVRPGQPDPCWGCFAPAVARWEAVLGRRAPRATDDRRRLNPTFVEWLMGLPAGHVTDVPDLTRTQQLKALGNGVVPQQAEAALRLLLARSDLTHAAEGDQPWS
ncbi:DNA cytosine methyltransferase [Streptomyces sp. NPDC051909]|uniref:DNA cytosine methyltransferase n=1 Tax=Streptomyces sp. NPDC051909 TaxID=3154944 RepID=UPI003418872A